MTATVVAEYSDEQVRRGAAYIFDMLGDRNRRGAPVEEIEGLLRAGAGVLRFMTDGSVQHSWCLVLLPKPFQGKRIHCGRVKLDLPEKGDPKPAGHGGSWAPMHHGDDIMYVFQDGRGVQWSRAISGDHGYDYDSAFIDLEDDLGADAFMARI